MKTFGILLLFTLGLLKCNKDMVIPASQNLAGQWKLLYQKGGFTGNQMNYPQGTVILVLNDNKTYQQLHNTTVEAQGNYEIGKVKSIFTGKDEYALKLDNADDWKIISFKSDTLWLTDNHVEPYMSVYKKIK